MGANIPGNDTPTGRYSAGTLRYVMLIAFLVVGLNLMDRYVVSILLEQIKADLSLTDTQLGWIVGPAFVIVHVLCQLPLARMADRGNRRNMIAGAMVLWSGFTMAAGAARSFPHLLLARMGVGISEAAASPTLASMLSDYFPPERRGRAMSMFSVGATAGIGAGMLVGGFVGEAWGWRVALVAAGLPGVLVALVVRFSLAEPVRGGSDAHSSVASPSAQPERPSIPETVRYLVRIPTFRWLVVGASFAMVAGIGRGAWEPVFLMRVYELDQSTAALWYFVISPVPSMLGAFLGGIAVDRLVIRDRRWGMWFPAAATLLGFPLTAAFLLWPVDSMLWGGLVPVGFAFSVVGSLVAGMPTPATIATGQSLSRPSIRAMTHALWTMASNLVAMGLGPLAVGWISETLSTDYGADSIRYALVIVSAVAVPGALALALGGRTIERDLDRASLARPDPASSAAASR